MKLIKHNNKFIVVNDDEINGGDWVYFNGSPKCIVRVGEKYMAGENGCNGEFYKPYDNDPCCSYYAKECIKIISENPDLSELSEEDLKKIYYLDANSLSEKVYRDFPDRPGDVEWHFNRDINAPRKRKAFIRGFNEANSLVEEMFFSKIEKQISDFKHDLIESTSDYIKQRCEGAIFGLERLKEELQQSKMFDCEIDSEEHYHSPSPIGMSKEEKPKIKNGKIKIKNLL